MSILVAIGVNQDGYREVLGVMEGAKEDQASWDAFLRYLKGRGLTGVRLFISDKCLGLIESLGEFYPTARWQRCAVHFYRNVWTAVPTTKVRDVAAMLKAIHAQEDYEAAKAKAALVVTKLREMKLAKAAETVATGIEETLQYFQFPSEHWRSLRTNNPLERLMRGIRRRTRVVGAFPDGNSALILVSARRRHVVGTLWGRKRYLDVSRLDGPRHANRGQDRGRTICMSTGQISPWLWLRSAPPSRGLPPPEPMPAIGYPLVHSTEPLFRSLRVTW